MREIKFRGKRFDTGVWVYGYLADENYINDINTFDLSSIEVDSDTVGQYTGLNDANGKEIYEGDIVRTSVAKNDIGLVEWNCERVAFVVHMKGSAQCYRLDKRDQIIGNIHDNPELMED